MAIVDYHSLPRKELQNLCKKNGIPANKTNSSMADALTSILKVDYHNLPRKELQNLCKKHGIPANKTNSFMADALTSILKVDKHEVDYSSLPRKELQNLCKKHGIPANKTNSFMADALTSILKVDKTNVFGSATTKTLPQDVGNKSISSILKIHNNREDFTASKFSYGSTFSSLEIQSQRKEPMEDAMPSIVDTYTEEFTGENPKTETAAIDNINMSETSEAEKVLLYIASLGTDDRKELYHHGNQQIAPGPDTPVALYEDALEELCQQAKFVTKTAYSIDEPASPHAFVEAVSAMTPIKDGCQDVEMLDQELHYYNSESPENKADNEHNFRLVEVNCKSENSWPIKRTPSKVPNFSIKLGTPEKEVLLAKYHPNTKTAYSIDEPAIPHAFVEAVSAMTTIKDGCQDVEMLDQELQYYSTGRPQNKEDNEHNFRLAEDFQNSDKKVESVSQVNFPHDSHKQMHKKSLLLDLQAEKSRRISRYKDDYKKCPFTKCLRGMNNLARAATLRADILARRRGLPVVGNSSAYSQSTSALHNLPYQSQNVQGNISISSILKIHNNREDFTASKFPYGSTFFSLEIQSQRKEPIEEDAISSTVDTYTEEFTGGNPKTETAAVDNSNTTKTSEVENVLLYIESLGSEDWKELYHHANQQIEPGPDTPIALYEDALEELCQQAKFVTKTANSIDEPASSHAFVEAVSAMTPIKDGFQDVEMLDQELHYYSSESPKNKADNEHNFCLAEVNCSSENSWPIKTTPSKVTSFSIKLGTPEKEVSLAKYHSTTKTAYSIDEPAIPHAFVEVVSAMINIKDGCQDVEMLDQGLHYYSTESPQNKEDNEHNFRFAQDYQNSDKKVESVSQINCLHDSHKQVHKKSLLQDLQAEESRRISRHKDDYKRFPFTKCLRGMHNLARAATLRADILARRRGLPVVGNSSAYSQSTSTFHNLPYQSQNVQGNKSISSKTTQTSEAKNVLLHIASLSADDRKELYHHANQQTEPGRDTRIALYEDVLGELCQQVNDRLDNDTKIYTHDEQTTINVQRVDHWGQEELCQQAKFVTRIGDEYSLGSTSTSSLCEDVNDRLGHDNEIYTNDEQTTVDMQRLDHLGQEKHCQQSKVVTRNADEESLHCTPSLSTCSVVNAGDTHEDKFSPGHEERSIHVEGVDLLSQEKEIYMRDQEENDIDPTLLLSCERLKNHIDTDKNSQRHIETDDKKDLFAMEMVIDDEIVKHDQLWNQPPFCRGNVEEIDIDDRKNLFEKEMAVDDETVKHDQPCNQPPSCRGNDEVKESMVKIQTNQLFVCHVNGIKQFVDLENSSSSQWMKTNKCELSELKPASCKTISKVDVTAESRKIKSDTITDFQLLSSDFERNIHQICVILAPNHSIFILLR
ncbi:hypothetical protein SUGI_0735500 [Cryptomeria japonica]|nr:hypothetical protein SUGI_0735500 [Cryptomeria japonica]